MVEFLTYPPDHDCTARGRNGMFKPDEIQVFDSKDKVELSVFSRRRDGAQPIYLEIPKEMVREVISALEGMV